MAAPCLISDLDAAKRAARVAALAGRERRVPAVGALLAAHVLAECPPPAGSVIAGFWPLAGEIDIRPLLVALIERGHPALLPVTPPRGRPLAFRRWLPGAPLVPGRFGTRHPEGPEMRPDVLFVPLLAFDRDGRRLGYGGGYYDRALAGLPKAVAIGCAFAAQEIREVPAGPGDARLALVATERGIIHCRIG